MERRAGLRSVRLARGRTIGSVPVIYSPDCFGRGAKHHFLAMTTYAAGMYEVNVNGAIQTFDIPVQ
jgi:hypothetical protein